MFADRAEAGRRLAERLIKERYTKPLVAALPRGGVPAGYQIARALNAPLDLVIAKKIGAPSNPELAVGAVTESGLVHVNEQLVLQVGITPNWLEEEAARQLERLKREASTYSPHRPRLDYEGREVILVDDGAATGYTMLAALQEARSNGPSRLVAALPVAPFDTVERFKAHADDVVCLLVPSDFFAVGEFYHEFSPVPDLEVIRLLDEANARHRDWEAC